jgi:hypothetical protein
MREPEDKLASNRPVCLVTSRIHPQDRVGLSTGTSTTGTSW